MLAVVNIRGGGGAGGAGGAFWASGPKVQEVLDVVAESSPRDRAAGGLGRAPESTYPFSSSDGRSVLAEPMRMGTWGRLFWEVVSGKAS